MPPNEPNHPKGGWRAKKFAPIHHKPTPKGKPSPSRRTNIDEFPVIIRRDFDAYFSSPHSRADLLERMVGAKRILAFAEDLEEPRQVEILSHISPQFKKYIPLFSRWVSLPVRVRTRHREAVATILARSNDLIDAETGLREFIRRIKRK